MDIVERLRSRQPYPLDAVGYLINPDGPEAANEIERLRREREIFSQALDDANEWGGELYADNERLRDEVHFDDQTIKSLFEIKDRLQESLKKIAELDIDRSVAQRYRPDGIPSKMDRCNHGIAMYDECAECVADFARAALKEEE